MSLPSCPTCGPVDPRAGACPRCGGPVPEGRSGDTTVTLPRDAPADNVARDSVAEPPPDGGRLSHPRRVGRFEVRECVGEGAFGVVYRAHDPQLDREVALKVAKPHALATPAQVERFLREARSAARLTHPHVVPVFEAGRDGDRHYLACGFVRGRTLEAELLRGRLAPRRAAEVVRALAEALAYAHRQGVVHRDVKPANVLLDERGAPHLTDFGLAVRPEESGKLTEEGAIVGTLLYLAPEQMLGRPGGPRPAGDQYSLGVLFYELLTGRTPFAGPPEQLLYHHVHADPTPPRRFARAVPRDLEKVCLKCLEKDPAKRYADCQALADDLRRWLEGEPVRARRPSLLRRLAQWRRRHPVLGALLAAGALLALGAGAGGLWYWDRYQRVKVEYYAHCVSRFGVKEGLGRLTEAQARRRAGSYKVYTRAGRVEQVDVVNGSGVLTADATLSPHLRPGGFKDEDAKECRFVYKRNEAGELLEEAAHDRNGQVVWVLHYTSPTTAHYTSGPREVGSSGRNAGRAAPVLGLPEARTRSGVVYLSFDWSSEGFEQEARYLGRDGAPHPDDARVWGVRREYDSRGLWVRMTYLDEDGRPTSQAGTAVVTVTRRHDPDGNVAEEAYFGRGGKPIPGKDGYHRCVVTFGAHGHDAEYAYFDVKGAPAVEGKEGYHRYRRFFDGRGNVVEEAYYDSDDRPTTINAGYHRRTCRYDDGGNRVEEAYFDAGGKPAKDHEHRAHRVTMGYDARGNLVAWAAFNPDGTPAADLNGYHRGTFDYDERGNLVEGAHFKPDGRPAAGRERIHRWTHKYDERGNQVEEAHFGVDGRPVADPEGAHRYTWAYDERGNTVGVAAFGTDGKPGAHREGWHRWTAKHDEWGHQTELAYFGPDGKPWVDSDGHHRTAWTYDSRGNQTEVAYFGPDGRPAADSDGHHRMTQTYDGRGKRTGQAYFGPDGKPATDSDGLHRYTWAYDKRGNKTEEEAFNKEGRRAVTWRYDKGLKSRATWYTGADPGATARWGRAVAQRRQTFDEDERVTGEDFVDAAGRPVVTSRGYARYRATFDPEGEETRTYFDLAGKPVATRVVVWRVRPGGKAEKRGLRAGDVVLRFNGRAFLWAGVVPASDEEILASAYKGKDYPLVVQRGDNTVIVVLPADLPGADLIDTAVPP